MPSPPPSDSPEPFPAVPASAGPHCGLSRAAHRPGAGRRLLGGAAGHDGGGLVLLDVRRRLEWEDSHISGPRPSRPAPPRLRDPAHRRRRLYRRPEHPLSRVTRPAAALTRDPARGHTPTRPSTTLPLPDPLRPRRRTGSCRDQPWQHGAAGPNAAGRRGGDLPVLEWPRIPLRGGAVGALSRQRGERPVGWGGLPAGNRSKCG